MTSGACAAADARLMKLRPAVDVSAVHIAGKALAETEQQGTCPDVKAGMHDSGGACLWKPHRWRGAPKSLLQSCRGTTPPLAAPQAQRRRQAHRPLNPPGRHARGHRPSYWCCVCPRWWPQCRRRAANPPPSRPRAMPRIDPCPGRDPTKAACAPASARAGACRTAAEAAREGWLGSSSGTALHRRTRSLHGSNAALCLLSLTVHVFDVGAHVKRRAGGPGASSMYLCRDLRAGQA